jgi:hypothetical protein
LDVYPVASLYYLLKDVKIQHFVPSQDGLVEVESSTIITGEPDKLIDSLVIRDSDITSNASFDGFTPCAGCNYFEISHSRVNLTPSSEARTTVFAFNTFSSGSTYYNQATACNDNWSGKLCIVSNNRFLRVADLTRFAIFGHQIRTLTAVTAPTGTSITVPYTAWDSGYDGLGTHGDIGMQLKQQGGTKHGIVSAIYDNGRSVTIEATFSAAPVAGEVYEYMTLKEARLDGFPYDYLDAVGTMQIPAAGVAEQMEIPLSRVATYAQYTNGYPRRASRTILCDATGGSVVVPLNDPAYNALNPPVGPMPDEQWTIKKTDASGNACTISEPGSHTPIDGADSVVLSTRNQSITVQWDYLSGHYWIVGKN